MRSHLKTVAVLEIVYATLGLLIGFGALVMFGGIATLVQFTDHSDGKDVAVPVLMAVGGLIALVLTVLSLPRLIAGIGLLSCRNWARVLSIILCALGVLEFPLGTALGVYGIWVLTNPETAALCERPVLRAA